MGPVEELLSRFRRYLEQERGLVPAAARGYVDKVRPFVARFDGPDGLELWRVDVAEVRGFVVDVCPRLGRRSAQLTVVALRSLLRFLHLDGVIDRSLAGAVPSVFAPRLSGLPKRLEAGQVDALFASCDTATTIGVRDLAILTVLARLGLRAAEVAGLSLDDVDWRAGELLVRGKGEPLMSGCRCRRPFHTAPPLILSLVVVAMWREVVMRSRQSCSTSGPNWTHSRPPGPRRACSVPRRIQS